MNSTELLGIGFCHQDWERVLKELPHLINEIHVNWAGWPVQYMDWNHHEATTRRGERFFNFRTNNPKEYSLTSGGECYKVNI